MDPQTQEVPGYYLWEVPGQPLAIHLHLELVETLLGEVMRGFGAVPKRGAEVGGVLLGSVHQGDRTIVRIEDFEPVKCSHTRGPSYLFTDEEAAAFEHSCARWRPDGSIPTYAVGYFRSHTRDGFSLSPEDIDLMERFFPEPEGVVLLIRPFATKPSTAAFFVRSGESFPDTPPVEFPFRRRELAGEDPLPRRPLTDRRPRDRGAREVAPAVPPEEIQAPRAPREEPRFAEAIPKPRLSGWTWVPLSFIFLLLGLMLGAALVMGTRAAAGGSPDFGLALTVGKSDDNLNVRWNRDAPAVRNAQRGVLEIQDGGYAKPVDLDAAHLQNGSIIYRNSSNNVRFRLVVYLNSRLSVSETLDWQQ